MADLDLEALKTLQSIEKLLKSTSMLSGAKQTFSSRAQISQKDRADKEARKAFKAVAAGAKESNDAILGLNKSLVNLNDEVGTTTKSFGALNSQMARFMTSLRPIEVPEEAPRQQTMEFNDSNLLKALHTMGGNTVAAIDRLAKVVQTQAQPQPVEKQTGLLGALFNRKSEPRAIKPTPKDVDSMRIPLRESMGRMVQNFSALSVQGAGLGVVFGKLMDAVQRATVDFFQLSRVGMGSVGNLTDLYKYSIMAGMSLKEYSDTLNSSMLVAARAGTLENYNRIISAQDQTLAQMGIFGGEARALQAHLAQYSAEMGINVNDLTRATGAQIDVFDKLRKSSNMTADQFAKMVDAVSNNEQAQKELLGLAPRERFARMNELLQLQTVGSKLGMTAEASQKLGEALINQRRASVKERFDQGAALLQMGAFTGNGAAGQRAFELNMKGRRRSADEDKELMGLVQQMDRTAQGMYENGSLGTQSVLDQLGENLEKGSLGELVKQGRGASLAQDAGKVGQEAFGKHVGEFGQWVGQLTAWTRGLQESIAGPLIAGVGAAVGFAFKGPLTQMFTGVLSRFGGAAAGGATGTAATAASAGGILARLAEPLTAVKNAGSSFFTWITKVPTLMRQSLNEVKLTNAISGPMNTMKFILQEAGSVIGGGVRGIMPMMNGMIQSLGRFPLIAGLLDAGIELVTGSLTDALNPSGGFWNRIGGAVTAFFSAIPRMIIDTLAFVFGENAMQPIRNGFDIFVASINMSIKYLLAKLIGGLGDMLSYILPDDSKLVKGLQATRDGLDDSAMENAVAIEKLWGDQSKTLESISKDNQKSAEAQNKTTAAATDKVNQSQQKFSNVMSSGAVSAAQVIQDAKTLAGPQTSVVAAQPQVQVPKTVTPATVNTDEQQAQTTAAAKSTSAPDNSEMLNVLNAMLQVLRDTLVSESHQAENSDAMLRLLRPQTTFSSAQGMSDKLLKRD